MGCFCSCIRVVDDEDDNLIVRNPNRTITNLGDFLDSVVERIRIWPPTRIRVRSTSQYTRILPPARTIFTTTNPQASSATSSRATANAESETVPFSAAPSFQLVNDGAAETKLSGGEGGKSSRSDNEGKPKMLLPLSFSNLNSQVGAFYEAFDVDEDVCPTCLEEYTEENPKIIAHCSHNFHLACILAWQERSEECPVCRKLMIFNERSEPIIKILNENYF